MKEPGQWNCRDGTPSRPDSRSANLFRCDFTLVEGNDGRESADAETGNDTTLSEGGSGLAQRAE